MFRSGCSKSQGIRLWFHVSSNGGFRVFGVYSGRTDIVRVKPACVEYGTGKGSGLFGWDGLIIMFGL